jgi:hypothetical protein
MDAPTAATLHIGHDRADNRRMGIAQRLADQLRSLGYIDACFFHLLLKA